MNRHTDHSIGTIPRALALCTLVAALCTTMFAQEKGQPSEDNRQAPPPAFLGPLTLSRTFVETQSGALSLTTTAAAAFSSRNVTCPATHANGCTLKIETSSQFWNITSGSVAQESISVSGGLTVSPSSLVNVDATSTGPLASVRTFQWTILNVPAGTTHTLGISFDVNSGTGLAGFRTATIELFLN